MHDNQRKKSGNMRVRIGDQLESYTARANDSEGAHPSEGDCHGYGQDSYHTDFDTQAPTSTEAKGYYVNIARFSCEDYIRDRDLVVGRYDLF